MIEINLLPRAGKKASRRSAAGSGGVLGALPSLRGKFRDPYLTGALVSLVAAVAVIGFLHLQHENQVTELTEIEQEAVQDSTRYAAILKEKYAAEAQRDSILTQLDIIRSIDNDRFVWPHLMEEVSRALPAYTWLTSIVQTSAPPTMQAAAEIKKDDKKAKKGAKKVDEVVDDDAVKPTMKFHMVGNTVDIQALTRFMKDLEASPFVQNVQLAKTSIVLAEGKEITEFQLDAEYQTPEPGAIRTVPVSLSVR